LTHLYQASWVHTVDQPCYTLWKNQTLFQIVYNLNKLSRVEVPSVLKDGGNS